MIEAKERDILIYLLDNGGANRLGFVKPELRDEEYASDLRAHGVSLSQISQWADNRFITRPDNKASDGDAVRTLVDPTWRDTLSCMMDENKGLVEPVGVEMVFNGDLTNRRYQLTELGIKQANKLKNQKQAKPMDKAKREAEWKAAAEELAKEGEEEEKQLAESSSEADGFPKPEKVSKRSKRSEAT